jgi:hypothetical protein
MPVPPSPEQMLDIKKRIIDGEDPLIIINEYIQQNVQQNVQQNDQQKNQQNIDDQGKKNFFFFIF